MYKLSCAVGIAIMILGNTEGLKVSQVTHTESWINKDQILCILQILRLLNLKSQSFLKLVAS